ncbi:DNA ligase [Campylobacter sp. TTU-622]|uniref:DNA ligase n=1 Tax=Campylobacter sp. TTU-622 TaxID=2800583 RepID=UPI001903437A|nr:DNA ligase [Campylobacter sp. TTU-622]MBK1972483.1 DNA ligase [Campylobacter sp. TTU-622]
MRKIVFLIFFISYSNAILLFDTYDENFFDKEDIKTYVMSEKLDGVRGIWDGKTFKTRKNNPIFAPLFFTQNFPNFALDGELWIQRKSFDEISALIRTNEANNTLWKQVTYNVFDVPNACEEFKLKECTLLNRLEILQEYLKKYSNAYIRIIPQVFIKDKKHLNDYYKNVLKNDGEGLIIRKNSMPYENKRSNFSLKLKPFFDDECKVVGYIKGKGKYENKIGALLCELSSTKVIKIGSGLKDSDRENPPKIGSIITYKFNGLTKNSLPRFPVFLRVRE